MRIKISFSKSCQDLFDVGGIQRVFGEFLGYDESKDETLLSYYVMEIDKETGSYPFC